jgi:MoxR-like ATPase
MTDTSLQRLREAHARVKAELHRTIVGQEQVIDQLLLAILTRGHCLLVGVPGLAKTLLISSLAKSLDLTFNRIQFTPDLMPGDITGTDLLHVDAGTNERTFRFAAGPIFANVVLADEINRTPPKTQAALLESMVEGQVTVGGRRHPLPNPFFVLATQNPIEQEGTYPLPEAQLDRFMFMVHVDYPSREEELEILRRTTGSESSEPRKVLGAAELVELQRIVRGVAVADSIYDYVLAITRGTRVGSPDQLPFVREWVTWGAGPRASQNVILGAKANAALRGSSHVELEDVRAIVHPVMRHRIVTNFSASAEGITPDVLIDRLLAEIDPKARVGAGLPGVKA